MDSCQFYPSLPCPSNSLRVIDLAGITGITFFLVGGRLYHLHAHRYSEPSALWFYERYPEKRQEFLVWVYLPLPQDEHIQAIGVQTVDDWIIPYFNILVRLSDCIRKSSNDVIDSHKFE